MLEHAEFIEVPMIFDGLNFPNIPFHFFHMHENDTKWFSKCTILSLRSGWKRTRKWTPTFTVWNASLVKIGSVESRLPWDAEEIEMSLKEGLFRPAETFLGFNGKVIVSDGSKSYRTTEKVLIEYWQCHSLSKSRSFSIGTPLNFTWAHITAWNVGRSLRWSGPRSPSVFTKGRHLLQEYIGNSAVTEHLQAVHITRDTY